MTTRRNFIKTFSRTLIAGGILGTGGYLLLKDTSGQTCDFDFPCKNCGKLSSCSETKAKEYRRSSGKGETG